MVNTTAIVDEPRYTDAEAISATEPARFTLSGTLSAEIDSDILIHAGDPDIHHVRYTRSENDAVLGTDGITIISGTNDITVSGFQTAFVNASGSLQTQIDSIEVTGVEPAIIGGVGITVTSGVDTTTVDGHLRYTSAENDAIIGVGEVVVTSGTGVVVISGTPHETDIDKDTISDAIIGGTGITVTSGSNTTTIDGHLRYTKDENDAIVAGSNVTVVSGANTITISSTGGGGGGSTSDALVGVDGITIISGSNTTTISGFRTEFVNASGSLQTQIDIITAGDVESVNSLTGAIDVIGKGEINVTVEGQNIVVSGTPHETDTDTDTISDALLGLDGITVISGANITTISGFRDEFVSSSGSLQTQIDAIEVDEVEPAIVGSGSITVTSGINIITVSADAGAPDVHHFSFEIIASGIEKEVPFTHQMAVHGDLVVEQTGSLLVEGTVILEI